MQAWSRFWRRLSARPVRQAWGLAQQGEAWSLVGLSLSTTNLVRVHTASQWMPVDGEPVWQGLGARLREAGLARGRVQHRVNMALASEQLVSGVLEFPVQFPVENWVTEVQLEASQMLGKQPDEVNFDFQPEHRTDGLVRRVHWVGCTQSQIADYKNCTRAAGWQLDSVEPAVLAAQRAAAALHGGLASLLTQSPQDWQFRLQEAKDAATQGQGLPLNLMPEPALVHAMKSEAGARLVASGLALKAWL